MCSSVPARGDGERLGEAAAVVREGLRTGDIELPGYVVSEANDQRPFNEEHEELGRVHSVSVYFTAEPQSDTADAGTT